MSVREKNKSKRFRLCVFKSNKHIYAQIIDDVKGFTLVSASSIKLPGNNLEVAKKIGMEIADLAVKKKIKDVVFDRGTYKYTGRIKALANSAREKGLNF